MTTLSRLQSEWRRLYGSNPAAAAAGEAGLIGADGRVRALVLSLARPADWQAIGRVWQGVQSDLHLPAPAIAVNGVDGFQLWFSLAEPVPAPEAAAWLDALRVRYLADIAPHRVDVLPTPDGARHAEAVPVPQPNGETWSAYVAPDLAPVFAETPWLDVAPGAEGQAELLSRLASIHPDDLQRAKQRLGLLPTAATGADAVPVASNLACPIGAGLSEPECFLLQVMRDERIDMALRIEAAKALLPRAAGR